MRVLVNQQAHLGHHYQYVAHLLDGLTVLTNDIVVALTPEGRASSEYRAFLAGFEDRVRFEPVLPEADPGYAYRERWRVHRDLRASVGRFKPDHVLIPSGDAQATAMAFHRLGGVGAVPGRVPCEVGIHFGVGLAAETAKERLRDGLNLMNLALSGADRVHLVNLLFYERARRLGPLRTRFRLMPHPVPPVTRMTKSEARRKLGVPEGGRYIGLAASLDSRKSIGEFIDAFRAATNSPDDRVLLAGWMNATHQRNISERHQDLVTSGRLIQLSGFLDQETFTAAIGALDVVCTPYPRFAGLSATLLEGVAAGRPILANHFGWSRAVVRRFGLGRTCDVLDHKEFANTIRTSLDESSSYQETDAIRRLLTFHTAANFAASWLERLWARTGASPPTPALDWEWVEEALPVGRRAAY